MVLCLVTTILNEMMMIPPAKEERGCNLSKIAKAKAILSINCSIVCIISVAFNLQFREYFVNGQQK